MTERPLHRLVPSQTVGKTDDHEAFDIGAQKARYVRINFRGANNGESYNSVTEFAVAKKK